jgi:nitrite reductase/ring-hydroxylating ferredoxin subunit
VSEQDQDPTPAEHPPAAEPDPPTPAEAPTPGVPRRRFLSLAGAGLGACVGAGVLGVAGSAVIGTPFTREGSGGAWFLVGPLARFTSGEPAKVPVLGELHDACNRFPARNLGNVLVLRQGETARAFSARCPHNGCDVFVDAPKLVCPCHDSLFSVTGQVEMGPSPRPLDELEVRVEEGQVWVRFQVFEVGTAEKRPV